MKLPACIRESQNASSRAVSVGVLFVSLTFLYSMGVFASERSLVVTATAYNSLPAQTVGDPTQTAWGDSLKPGMKAIAVSRDLLELGLEHETLVTIEGLPGQYRVLDKMAARWSRKIDIYMGEDVQAAREWGKRQVTIRWK